MDKIRLLAFDVDGTLFSTENIIAGTYQSAIRRFSESSGENILVPSKEAIINEIGKPVKTIFRNLLPDISEEERDIISRSVLHILCEKIENGEGHYYEGIQETIEGLNQAGFIICAASNGRYPYIESVLKTAGVFSYFDSLVTLDYEKIHQKGEILNVYKQEYRLTSKEILMIGDRASDREAADFAETYFLYCEYGHANPGEVTRYDWKVDSLLGMLGLFGLR
ncbi:MAG: HAD family hydrolase [Leptospiraceae bacterium]|nr:HAD family hydrolase [Leptospiraceae bacterium]MCP5503461.1 HAD family hydrolase [Leptospiraceae bacterium]